MLLKDTNMGRANNTYGTKYSMTEFKGMRFDISHCYCVARPRTRASMMVGESGVKSNPTLFITRCLFYSQVTQPGVFTQTQTERTGGGADKQTVRHCQFERDIVKRERERERENTFSVGQQFQR